MSLKLFLLYCCIKWNHSVPIARFEPTSVIYHTFNFVIINLS